MNAMLPGPVKSLIVHIGNQRQRTFSVKRRYYSKCWSILPNRKMSFIQFFIVICCLKFVNKVLTRGRLCIRPLKVPAWSVRVEFYLLIQHFFFLFAIPRLHAWSPNFSDIRKSKFVSTICKISHFVTRQLILLLSFEISAHPPFEDVKLLKL